MRKYGCHLPSITRASRRDYAQDAQGPLASNKQLLAGIKRIRSSPTVSKNEPEEADKHGNLHDADEVLAIQTQLPQSPLMFKHLGKKSPQTQTRKAEQKKEELSPFQQELQTNIFAHALASPVRMCRITMERLPRDFLLQHGLSTHPKTRKKWNLPILAGQISHQEQQTVGSEHQSSTHATDAEGSVPVTSNRQRTLSGFNLLSSYKILDLLSREKLTRKHHEIIPLSWKEGSGLGKKSLVWREDMADFTLGLMRQESIRLMNGTLSSKRATDVVPCDSWDDVLAQTPLSSILYLSNDTARADPVALKCLKHLEGGSISDIGSWTAGFHEGHNAPIFFASTLLGSEHLALLREKWPEVLGKDILVFPKKTTTVQLQASLWKLAGFLS